MNGSQPATRDKLSQFRLAYLSFLMCIGRKMSSQSRRAHMCTETRQHGREIDISSGFMSARKTPIRRRHRFRGEKRRIRLNCSFFWLLKLEP
ncbi:hypothetical protein L596_013425 [Steinernema carpocapsae]|uniref:Uncharacterized protein n=1 Tax=Steinernema carpocapsae TaxID=34508 RepID=A0A4U5P042_STECR|nr:hypothetical protein L596_013425 [Steinernema carpocapsae]